MKTRIDVQINAFSLEDLSFLIKVNVEEMLAIPNLQKNM